LQYLGVFGIIFATKAAPSSTGAVIHQQQSERQSVHKLSQETPTMRPLGAMLILLGGTLALVQLAGTRVALLPTSDSNQLAYCAGAVFFGLLMIILAPREVRN
jgi:hypothetical protein